MAEVSLDLFGQPYQGPQPEVRGKRPLGPWWASAYPAEPGTGPEGEHCRTCAFKARVDNYSRYYQKCFLLEHRWTCGKGTDIRAGSPACRYWHRRPFTRTRGGAGVERLDLVELLKVQDEWSRATFGRGPCTPALVEHVRAEVEEVIAAYTGDGARNYDVGLEWVDVALLALDGVVRAMGPDLAAKALWRKLRTNMGRTWVASKDGTNMRHQEVVGNG